ncbi:MAG: helix-turn-helix domain-containing protein [Aquabacterium sp.]|uniref:helix-turn-helix domain-containing protein n=1 Tax=Aquabacterium sp. TaxID=1872578 RepID=UPI003BAE2BD5
MNNQDTGPDGEQGAFALNERIQLNDRLQQYRMSVVDRVAMYLTAKGVAERNHAAKIGSITGISALQNRRKLKGETSFAVEEVALIASHFDDPPSAIFNIQWHTCELEIAGERIQARADIGKRIDAPGNGQLAARRGNPWQLILFKEGDAEQDDLFEVKEVELVTNPEKLKVAVLDDDEDVAGMIADALQDLGYLADPFSSENQLSESIDRHDAFIVDYKLGPHQTAAQLIARIRANKPHALILLLTGQAKENLDADIARLMHLHDSELHEKPVRISILASAIQRWMNKQRAR